jgi:predicted nuclease of restriction endonuclease-like (RecB) superfamily
MQDNPSYQKEEILQKLLELEKDFTFIIESKNGFHFYIELQDGQYIHN